jgi:hypothetical protein
LEAFTTAWFGGAGILKQRQAQDISAFVHRQIERVVVSDPTSLRARLHMISASSLLPSRLVPAALAASVAVGKLIRLIALASVTATSRRRL